MCFVHNALSVKSLVRSLGNCSNNVCCTVQLLNSKKTHRQRQVKHGWKNSLIKRESKRGLGFASYLYYCVYKHVHKLTMCMGADKKGGLKYKRELLRSNFLGAGQTVF